jgi:uncharacterized protein (TIGR03435 family)
MNPHRIVTAALLFLCLPCVAQTVEQPNSFEVATIKPVDPGEGAGRFIRMDGPHRFVGKNFTLKLLIAAAYDLNPRTISGGPSWVESDKFDINALTPTEQPDRVEQMAMLRKLLTDRFELTFHRQPKTFAIYELTQAKDGAKLKPTAASAQEAPKVISVVYPDRITMPGRNASMADLTAVLQRAVLDRPVVDKTGLTGRYDFDLTWSSDESQFGGEIPPRADSEAPPLMEAFQEQLGLQLKATRGQVQALVIDGAEKPSSN